MLVRRWGGGEGRGRNISMERGSVRGRDIGRSWFGGDDGCWVSAVLLVIWFVVEEGLVLIYDGMCVGVELSIAMVSVVGMRLAGILFVNTIRQGTWRGSMRRRWGK